MERDNSLDVIRVIAMAMIVLCHFFQIIGVLGIAFWLNTGVQIFFVMSAFLLCKCSFGSFVAGGGISPKEVAKNYASPLALFINGCTRFVNGAISNKIGCSYNVCTGSCSFLSRRDSWFRPFMVYNSNSNLLFNATNC